VLADNPPRRSAALQEADYAFDLSRILLGNRPWIFLVEIFLRTAIMYCYVLLLVRFLGKRGMGQLAPFDFVIVIALGSATQLPMATWMPGCRTRSTVALASAP
jgi:hypothetical protein